ncbi:DUF998 domain-containing protein [Paenibacillus sp. N1-5-1-14]|uniref:DUF998 domain-containing protein n=1 Tax=Paenibacillus radicibacter TaxID=2972488 RepID=UPI002158B06D|nr:DUF998 domain-containing protein [Paenibacillus radicibacter]MCR8643792.1 DUF998 domain-containing protein [Paenibacillus radicibacter]
MKKSLIKLLLIGGILSAPLFFLITIAQVFTRTGFDIRIHAISSLTLGDLGWIQSANFIITGLLAVFAAIGILHRIHLSHCSMYRICPPVCITR